MKYSYHIFHGVHNIILSTCILLSSPILGEPILSGQSNNLTVLSEVNTTLIPDRYSNDVAEFFMRENVTVVDGLANISRNGLCSNAAAPIMEILATFTSLEISCSDCGQKFNLHAQWLTKIYYNCTLYPTCMCKGQNNLFCLLSVVVSTKFNNARSWELVI